MVAEDAARVVAQAEPHEVAAHLSHDFFGDLLRMTASRLRGELVGQAERIEPAGIQNVEPGHAAESRIHVAHHVVADMAKMEAAVGKRRKLDDNAVRAVLHRIAVEQMSCFPGTLPFLFYLCKRVRGFHCGSLFGDVSCELVHVKVRPTTAMVVTSGPTTQQTSRSEMPKISGSVTFLRNCMGKCRETFTTPSAFPRCWACLSGAKHSRRTIHLVLHCEHFIA